MKRWLAPLLFLASCSPQPMPPAPGTPATTAAAAIPEGRTPEERRDLFAAALSLYEQGKHEPAEVLFRRADEVYPALADYAARYLAKLAEARHDDARALVHWGTIASRYRDSVWRGEAELALARARARTGDWPGAAAHCAAAREDLDDPEQRAAALWLASQAARHLGHAEESRALVAELRSHHPSSPEAAAARDAAWAEREAVALRSARRAGAEVSLLLSEGEARRALELVRLAAARHRSPAELPGLLWLEARALDQSGDRDGSLRLLERLCATYPRHPAAAQALYRLASLAWNRDDDGEALRLFGRYAWQYPHGAQTADCLYAVGRIHQEAGRFDRAARQFARLARTHPQSPLAVEARFRVGWCQYRAGHRALAGQTFRDLAELGGRERAAALYWRARATGDVRALEELLRESPETYYAGLAERRLGRVEGSALASRVATTLGLPDAATCHGGESHLARFGELKTMRLHALARRELSAFERLTSGCDGLLIGLWSEVEGYRQSVGRALHAARCGLDSPWLRYCYPLGFRGVIEEQAARRSLDPHLVVALIRQESLFDSRARSAANAVGLMQILPPTGERLAASIGLGDFHDGRLADPTANVSLGTAYLRELLDRYQGNLPRALAAYNAGEAAVDKWQRRYAGLEDDEFVESISYRETRGYVKRVLQNHRIYQALYGRERSAGGG
ncbi:MAG: transglycosylase SLT domain-containing protein [Deltaproteobacteria bacterium]|nr:transglycosylase SLT domain-containing protein [Deltaproteobacteria bacterium]